MNTSKPQPSRTWSILPQEPPVIFVLNPPLHVLDNVAPSPNIRSIPVNGENLPCLPQVHNCSKVTTSAWPPISNWQQVYCYRGGRHAPKKQKTKLSPYVCNCSSVFPFSLHQTKIYHARKKKILRTYIVLTKSKYWHSYILTSIHYGARSRKIRSPCFHFDCPTA